MNWAAITFDWNQVRAFLATAEEGSLSAAARALGLTQPTLGRQVTALETALDVVLFERVGRTLSLTPTGRELLTHVQAMGEAATRLSLVASGQNQAIEGRVCITASDAFSAYILPPILSDLRALAPGITLDVVAANDIRDLQQREADIAIRHVRPSGPELIARQLRDMTGHFYASTSYLAERGHPGSVADLTSHIFIGYQPIDRFITELGKIGIPVTEQQISLMTENGVVAWELAKQGLGIGVMMRDIADMTDGIEQILPGFPPVPIPIWLTAHRELLTSRRIRLVFDFLAEALS